MHKTEEPISHWGAKKVQRTSSPRNTPRPSLQELLFNTYPHNRTHSLADIFSPSTSPKLPLESLLSTPSKMSRTPPKNIPPSKLAGFLGPTASVVSRALSNIFGVVLFTRLAPVFGTVGIAFGPLLVLLCEAVVFLTALSVSAVVTNGKVESGGVYFLVSRALGPTFGLTIGAQFFFANSFSVALYLLGLSEAVETSFGLKFAFSTQIVAICALIFVFGVSLVGSRFVFFFQICSVLPLLIVAVGSVVSGAVLWNFYGNNLFLRGFSVETISGNLIVPSAREFYGAVSIFFPGTLGMMAGANYAENLDRPGKSLPRGLIIGITISTSTYILMGLLISSCISNEHLVSKPLILAFISLNKWTVLPAGFLCIMSQAFTNFIMAPLLLVRIVQDNLMKHLGFLSRSHTHLKSQLITFFIALLVIMPGKFDVIAPFVTSFTIITYSVLNFACFLQSFYRSPNWRPNFKFYNAYVSLTTSVSYIVIMFFLDYVSAVISLGVTAALIGLIALIKPRANWSGAMESITLHSAIKTLKFLDRTTLGPKNYCIQILVLCGRDRDHLIKFGTILLKRGNPVNTFALFIPVQEDSPTLLETLSIQNIKTKWVQEMSAHKGFSTVFCSHCILEGVKGLIQSCGVSKIKPNILLIGFKNNWQSDLMAAKKYVDVIRTTMLFGKAVIIVRHFEKFSYVADKEQKVFDIWWVEEDGGLGLLIPYIASLSKIFSRTKLRVFEVLEKGGRRQPMPLMAQLLFNLRIPAIVVPVEMNVGMDYIPVELLNEYYCLVGKESDSALDFATKVTLAYAAKIEELSKDSEIVFITCPIPTFAKSFRSFLVTLEVLSRNLRHVVFVRGNHEDVLTFRL